MNPILLFFAAQSLYKEYNDPTISGSPNITVDPDGNVTGYEFTEPTTITDEGINTHIVPFKGTDWNLDMTGIFDPMGFNTYQTLLSAMVPVPPYKGFVIRYEYRTLYFITESTVVPIMTLTSYSFTLNITYINKVLTVTFNNNQVYSKILDYDLSDVDLIIGADVDSDGNYYRYGTVDVDSFNFKQL